MTIELNYGQVRLADGTVSDVAKELSLMSTDKSAADIELEHLAEEALKADLEAKEAADRQKAAKDAFKKALQDRGMLASDTKAVGPVRTIIKKTRRFSKTLAKQLLTPEEVAKYSDIDSALVKANVAPNVYEMFQEDQGFSLELKVAD
jgi:hypothetical protein